MSCIPIDFLQPLAERNHGGFTAVLIIFVAKSHRSLLSIKIILMNRNELTDKPVKNK